MNHEALSKVPTYQTYLPGHATGSGTHLNEEFVKESLAVVAVSGSVG